MQSLTLGIVPATVGREGNPSEDSQRPKVTRAHGLFKDRVVLTGDMKAVPVKSPRLRYSSLRTRFILSMAVMLLPLVVLAVGAFFSLQSAINAIDTVVQAVSEEVEHFLGPSQPLSPRPRLRARRAGPRLGIGEPEGLAGVINEQFLAGPVLVAQADVEGPR